MPSAFVFWLAVARGIPANPEQQMKYFIHIFLTIVLSLALYACKNDESSTDPTPAVVNSCTDCHMDKELLASVAIPRDDGGNGEGEG